MLVGFAFLILVTLSFSEQVSYMIVDEMHHEHPELIKDQYWDEVFPSELPYTIATENQREEHPEHSTARIAVPARQRSMVLTTPSQIQIDKMVPSNTVSYKFDPPEVRPVRLYSMQHGALQCDGFGAAYVTNVFFCVG